MIIVSFFHCAHVKRQETQNMKGMAALCDQGAAVQSFWGVTSIFRNDFHAGCCQRDGTANYSQFVLQIKIMNIFRVTLDRRRTLKS